jgi:hypothetical protein
MALSFFLLTISSTHMYSGDALIRRIKSVAERPGGIFVGPSKIC